jgi:hypothetical protein
MRLISTRRPKPTKAEKLAAIGIGPADLWVKREGDRGVYIGTLKVNANYFTKGPEESYITRFSVMAYSKLKRKR